MSRLIGYVGALLLVLFVTACSPKVGSESWCEKMANTPQGEWTPQNGLDFADSCDIEKLLGD